MWGCGGVRVTKHFSKFACLVELQHRHNGHLLLLRMKYLAALLKALQKFVAWLLSKKIAHKKCSTAL